MTYSLSSPFIIEKVLGYSAVMTGYSSLLSGLAIMSGGIIAKSLIKVDLKTKVVAGLIIQFVFILLMIFTASWANNIFTLICFTICIHASGGFVFNIIFGYCLSRFTKNAGVAAGITGGAMYMISSIFSYSFANLFAIKSQMQLGLANASLAGLMVILFVFFIRSKNKVDRS
ncbi:putative transporter [compost metagenome]